MQSSPPGAILREPRIQELYEAVSALKPKLGRSLSTVVGTYGTNKLLSLFTIESLVDMHAKLNTVVRYYDKMLEDRLATTYSQATYQEARPPAHSSQPYQYNLPPQSPAFPPQQGQGYFPSRRSTLSDHLNTPLASQVPHDSPSYYSTNQPTVSSQNWAYSNYPPTSMSPVVAKSPNPQSYADSAPYHYEQSNPPVDHHLSNQAANLQQVQPPYQAQSSYPSYTENSSYYEQKPLGRREESSLIDL
jgi:hepatocyte growth factor-regulated tyrosine kinase substrate